MERWVGKIAVVTGASSGIGAAVAVDLVKSGLIVVGLARRKQRIMELQSKLIGARGKLYACECEYTNDQSIKNAFDWIETEIGGVNILINNAGIAPYTTILNDRNSMSNIRRTIDTNLMGLIVATKAAFNILQRTGEYGHIINISSIAAHNIPVVIIPGGITPVNIYPGTKHAVRVTSEILRQELVQLNKKVKISQISPGNVQTEILAANNYKHVDEIYKIMPTLTPKDISDIVIFILGTPPNVQIHDIVVKPVGEMV